jgi:hypothetical protein
MFWPHGLEACILQARCNWSGVGGAGASCHLWITTLLVPLLTQATITINVCPPKHSSKKRTSCYNCVSRSDTPSSKEMLGQSISKPRDLGLKASLPSFIMFKPLNWLDFIGKIEYWSQLRASTTLSNILLSMPFLEFPSRSYQCY